MPRHNNDDALDENGILKDGCSVRYSLLTMDGKRRRAVSLSDSAAQAVTLHDGLR